MCILISHYAVHPGLTHQLAVQHNIYFLRVEVRLRVLVPVPLDPDMSIDNHQFNVAAALFELIVDGTDLIFRDVVVDVEVVVEFLWEFAVEAVSEHLVVAVLEREELAGVVVAEAVVVRDANAAAAGGDDLGEKRLSVEVGGLDENGRAGVTKGGEESFILRCVDAMVVRSTPRFPADHGNREWWVGRQGNQWCEGIVG